jgi:fumarylpyruvate hydrolase
MEYAITPDQLPSVAVAGTDRRFPVHRIYCVGRNYAAHVKEMGKSPERDPPFFFTKPADAVVPSGAEIDYPPRTENLHHEIELVVAIGAGAKNVSVSDALDIVWGYAVGNDLTRRDLQLAARDTGRPWDTGKAFDQSAPLSAIHRVSEIGHIDKGRIWLSVNGTLRQEGDVSELIWNVPEIVAELSSLFELRPGDLIFTGTPAGVGPLQPGDQIVGGIDGLDTLTSTIRTR